MDLSYGNNEDQEVALLRKSFKSEFQFQKSWRNWVLEACAFNSSKEEGITG